MKYLTSKLALVLAVLATAFFMSREAQASTTLYCVPNAHYVARSGTAFTASSTGVVTASAGDIGDLLIAGCLPQAATNVGQVLIYTTGTSGLSAAYLNFLGMKNIDGTNLAASPAAGKFGITVTLATSEVLTGETSNNNTKTDDVLSEYIIPATYVAGQNLTITSNVAINTAGSPTYATKTWQAKVYKISADGTSSADIGPGTTSAITVAGANVTATVTGTTLSPGDKILIEQETVLHDTAAVACNTLINSTTIQ